MRLVIFAAMAALLVVSLCVPEAFDASRSPSPSPTASSASPTSPSFMLASPDDAALRRLGARPRRRAPRWRAASVGASFSTASRRARSGRWRSVLDMAGPYFFGPRAGARPRPLRRAPRAGRHHRPRRVDRRDRRRRRRALDCGIAAAAVLGVALAAALWWIYFDVVALVAGAAPGATPRRAGRATSWPATPTPTCTCRWSPGSSSSRWA